MAKRLSSSPNQWLHLSNEDMQRKHRQAQTQQTNTTFFAPQPTTNAIHHSNSSHDLDSNFEPQSPRLSPTSIAASQQSGRKSAQQIFKRTAEEILFTQVTFKLIVHQPTQCTNFAIIGNHPLLGSWDLTKAPQLTLSPFDVHNQHTVFSVILSLPTNIPIEYRYICKDNHSHESQETQQSPSITISTPAGQQQQKEQHHNHNHKKEQQQQKESQQQQQQNIPPADIKRKIVPVGFHMSVVDTSDQPRGIDQNIIVDKGFLEKQHCHLRIFLGDSFVIATRKGTSDHFMEFSGIKLYEPRPYVVRIVPIEHKTLTSGKLMLDNIFSLWASTRDELSFFVELFADPYDNRSRNAKRPGSGSLSRNGSTVVDAGLVRIARTFISSKELVGDKGRMTRALLGNDMIPCGDISLQFLIVNPFVHPKNTITALFNHVVQSPKKFPFYIGHRGLGASDQHLTSQQISPADILTENTLLSFVTAAQLGAEYIEFDVQLTKDNVPIIIHDEELVVLSAAADESTVSLKIPVTKLRYDEIKLLKPIIAQKSPTAPQLGPKSKPDTDLIVKLNPRLRRSRSESELQILDEEQQPTVLKKHGEKTEMSKVTPTGLTKQDFASYPSLREVFQTVPSSVGFNIEIKYPDNEQLEKYYDVQQRNFYVDTILDVIFNFAKDRSVMISSFDPDVCTIVAMKQIRIPVFFLTCGGTDGYIYEDKRRNSVRAAIEFARAAKLDGIVSDARPVLEDASVIEEAHKSHLLIFTYGSPNAIPTNVTLQRDLGVDAVIADNVIKVKKTVTKASLSPSSLSQHPSDTSYFVSRSISHKQ